MSNKTIFGRLDNIFGGGGGKTVTRANNVNSYTIDNKELLRTTDKEEFENAKLEAQQAMFLKNQWKKVDNETYQSAIHYETTRIGSYTDFENMELYPEISAALDIMMEEASTLNDKGEMLTIFSESERVKNILNDLFFNRLDVHSNLPMWIRNTCKYGDNFLYLKMEDNLGVIGTTQLRNFEIERRETELFKNDKTEDDETKFIWKGKDVEFKSWQVAHFRLLGDDRKLPYGTSVLEKARRIWKQLLLSEDAMLVYRVTRAPERRVFKVFVGNINDKDVGPYMNDIANRFKRTPLMDPQTGQIDLRYNQMAYDQDFFIPVRDENAPSPIETLPGACITLDTKIPLLDGRTLELNEIINEWDNGNRDLWVYSCDPDTGKVAPGIITWAGETRKNAEVIKITLDNGESITTTPDHKWVHRTKGFVEAQDLNVGDSLMPFYRDTKTIKSNTNGDYERVWDNESQEWVFTHRMVTSFMESRNKEAYLTFKGEHLKDKMQTIHHLELDANYNHKITNIEWLDTKINTGTITVDGDEMYHNYHTFAVSSGVFIKNSNLDQISDIEHLQKKLFTALRVPKSFLGYDEAQGEGKNLALQDIRFTRTINRIQQSIIMELNKVAIIHLYLLGMEEDLDNFKITMNNPSTQAEMLKVEHLQQKITAYRDAVSDSGNGFAAYSMVKGKKEILGMSNDEIKEDLLQQRFEKAAAAELENTSKVIKHTGTFDKVDRIYGDMEIAKEGGASEDSSDSGDKSSGGGSSFGGGGSISDEDLDFGDEEVNLDDEVDIEDIEDDLGDIDVDTSEVDNTDTNESTLVKTNLILEGKRRKLKIKNDNKVKKYNKIYTDRLLESLNDEDKKPILHKMENDKLKVNEQINEMISGINKII